MNLFQRKMFKMHSGGVSHYKIECDALTDEDIACIAYIIAQKGPVRNVYGVPTGGTRLADALEPYKTDEGIDLIVDDVLSTGASMEEARTKFPNPIGVVIFARGNCPEWVYPVFEMNWFNTDDWPPQKCTLKDWG